MSNWTDLAFTDAVKAVQTRYGTREICANYERAKRPAEITPDLAQFIAARDSAYLATSSADGRPYIQHRGGPPGFLKVLDRNTIGFAEHPGNKQLITTGNLSENNRAFMFLMDYATRTRIKLWGRAEIIDDDAEFIASVSDRIPGMKTTPDKAVRFTVEAWDINCKKHIPLRYSEHDDRLATARLTERIAELEAELVSLRPTRGD